MTEGLSGKVLDGGLWAGPGLGKGYCRQVSWKASRVRKSLHVGGRPSCRNFPQRWHGAWNSFM